MKNLDDLQHTLFPNSEFYFDGSCVPYTVMVDKLKMVLSILLQEKKEDINFHLSFTSMEISIGMSARESFRKGKPLQSLSYDNLINNINKVQNFMDIKDHTRYKGKDSMSYTEFKKNC